MQKRKLLLSFAATIALISFNTALYAKEDKVSSLDDVEVFSTKDNITENSNSYKIDFMSTSTKMNLSVLETPQSVSVVTHEQMEDFNLSNINKVLENTTGITVEKMESDRTQFTSRGFEVRNFLVDGVNLPLSYSYQYGDIDTAIFDRVEVTKGASGLVTAQGDPSATVNMIRKRPTKEFQGSIKLSGGSYDMKRVDADVSGALNDSKDLTARLIVAKEDSESHLDRYESDSTLISGIMKKEFSDTAALTFGVTRYEDKNDGAQWGGIPAFTGKDYDVSTNAASDWSFRDVTTTDAFIELENYLSDDWKIKTTYLYKDVEQDANLINLWISGGQLQIDGAQDYQLESKEHLVDITVDGTYSLFGKEHEAVFGMNWAKRETEETSKYDNDITGTPIDLDTWDGSTARPVFDDRTDGTDIEEKQLAFFVATNYHLTNNLNLLVGTRYSNWEREGTGYWDSDESSKDTGELTPYAGLVYKINNNLSTYLSYTTSYTPQKEIDKNAKQIDPKEGVTYEFGIKSTHLNDRLNTSFALFKTRQDNVAVWAGTLTDGTGRNYYEAESGVLTRGFEAEISGAITDRLNTSIGYTQLIIDDSSGDITQTYIPRKTLKASLTYKPEFSEKLKLGAAVKYNDKTSISAWYGSASQDAYTIVDLMANYEINKNLKVSLNIDNITDKKYYGSLVKPYINYAAPRTIGVSLEYKF